MSAQSTQRSITARRLCRQCQERPRRFAVRRQGRIRIARDNDHELCFQCYRGVRNQAAAEELVNMEEATKKVKGVEVGDQLQYQFTEFSLGQPHVRLTTRRVTQVIGAGAGFRVEGGYLVDARQVRVHIARTEPSTSTALAALDDWDTEDGFAFCGVAK